MRFSSRFLFLAMALSLIVLGGCKDEKTSTRAESSEASETSEKEGALQKAPAASPLFEGTGVIAYGGLQNLNALTKLGSDAMTIFQFLPAAAVPSMLTEGLKDEMNLVSLEWLDKEAPIRVLILDPKKYNEGGLLCFPIKGDANIEKVLPAGFEKDKDGNAYAYKTKMGELRYVNLFDGHAVFSLLPGIFGDAKPALEKDLKRIELKSAMEFTLVGPALMTTFKDELEEAKAEAIKAGGSGANGDVNIALYQGAENVEVLFGLVKDLRTLSIGVDIKSGHLSLAFGLTAAPGSLAAKLMNEMGGNVPGLLGILPENAYFVTAQNVSPSSEALKQLNDKINGNGMEALGEAFSFDEATKKKYKENLEILNAEMTGDGAFAVYADQQFPFAMMYASSAKDGAKASSALNAVMKIVWSGLAKELSKEMANALPPGVKVDWTNLDTVISSTKPLVEPLGVELKKEVKAGTDGVTMELVRLKVDFAKLPLSGQEKALAEQMKAVMGDSITLAIGSSDKRLGMAFGPNAPAALRQALTTQGGKVSKAVAGALERGVKSASGVFSLDVVKMLKAVALIPAPEVAAIKPLVQGLPESKGGFAGTTGSSADSSLNMVWDLSLEDAAALVRAFQLSPM